MARQNRDMTADAIIDLQRRIDEFESRLRELEGEVRRLKNTNSGARTI
jgi:hypothetical protein